MAGLIGASLRGVTQFGIRRPLEDDDGFGDL